MPTTSADMSALEPAIALAELAEKIAGHLRPSQTTDQAILRVEVPVIAQHPALWLTAQSPAHRTYWSDRDRTRTIAGVGAAANLTQTDSANPRDLFARIQSLLNRCDSDIRLYGGFGFDNLRTPAGHWRPFAAAQFVLPRFELVSAGDKTALAANLLLSDDGDHVDEILHDLSELTFEPPGVSKPLPTVRRRSDNPDRGTWMARVQHAVDAIHGGNLEKIVLARESRFDLEQSVDPMLLVAQLQAVSPQCFVFCFEPADSSAFVGASPERLYRREGRSIFSEALAGTRPRGTTDEDDRRLGEKLLTSQKEAREHAYVADTISGVLNEFCRSLHGRDQRALVKLARVQHLITRFEGELHDTATDADLIIGLHPTPAVGGVPTEIAKAMIRDLEAFDRGWYAGPVGWIGRDNAEFTVAIRSALVDRSTLRLYSGAGIVSGSHPDREWDEIENKIAGYLKLLAAP